MTESKPIIFVSPGGTPDTCLTVFGQDFHAESAVLRLHSGFFRTFLIKPSETPHFKYEYASKMDKDGSWGLQQKSTVDDGTSPNPTLTTEKAKERHGFHNLLRALYLRRILGQDGSFYTKLTTLVRLADFYRALPIVSVMVDASLSPVCLNLLSQYCFKTLDLAFQLRSSKLFNDAFIHVISQAYEDPQTVSLVDKKFHKLVYKYLAELTAKVLGTSHELHRLVAEASAEPCFTPNQMIGPAMLAASKRMDHPLELERSDEPRFYQHLLEAHHEVTEAQRQSYMKENGITVGPPTGFLEGFARSTIADVVAPLMVSYLNYQQPRDYEHFLCTRLLEKDIPWDQEETDW